ncbi:hypothetical protein HZY91_05005 [Facklamia sp. DSM 111018]|uniref:Uncharacterized protein n=1 Tax=Facklamia lactis TaxID=2749967 RepID=A0ABS0LS13_9LACT|nr:hypothetical protein [Facklamia lactis]MBG9986250.1 hypothetical protein [Facklamia lactis]
MGELIVWIIIVVIWLNIILDLGTDLLISVLRRWNQYKQEVKRMKNEDNQY